MNPVDLETVVAIMRKNADTFTQANRTLFEGMQVYANRLSEITREYLEQAGQFANDYMATNPEEKVTKLLDLSKAQYERTITNVNELAKIAEKSQQDAMKLISRRISEGLDEYKDTVNKKTKK